MNLSEYKGVLVFIEQRNKEVQKVSMELLGKGRSLADTLGVSVTAALLGHDVTDIARDLIVHGADKVVIADDKMLELFVTEPYTKALVGIIKQENPEIVLFGATSIGRDLAPRVSARVHTGLTADCTSLDIEDETKNLLMTRPAFGGNIMATIACPDFRPQMSTVRPGVMQKMASDHNRKGEIVAFDAKLEAGDMNVEILEYVKETKAKANIDEAGMLISAGRGVGGKDNLGPLYELADTIGGLVSGSRAVIDAGWLDKDRQVGQTGKTVRPEVYMACGISGAIQHVAGMEESELIIAVNKNPDAAIFEVADLGLVGDVAKILPLVTDLIKKVKKEANEK
ncbi:electron transfer flavoprotein subunit alpha/FixB family protein [Proteocatella sphenisci]|uniref:electron transfer flavoprotein subunit alpha/FixB family protein n=1 Tax=Proteocatella sphenisci TaxID=181070 RepID=UPI000491DD62|nr:electron transfer flavoprotein subunit alpha/FixB family protein [Proteocatella sphenisci]